MRVAFLQDRGINESLAVCELSAFLKARGHETRLFLERNEWDFWGAVRRWRPEAAALPIDVIGVQWGARTLAEAERRLGVPVVACGAFPTMSPEGLESLGVRLAVRGEAEEAFADLLDRMDRGASYDDVPNLWMRTPEGARSNPLRPLRQDLDALPMPDRELYFRYRYLRRLPFKRFVAQRGCAYECAYCFHSTLKPLYAGKGPYVRRKSVGRVLEEIAAVRAASALRTIHFADDLFGLDRDWLREFARRYPEEAGFPFTCNATADHLDEEVATLLSRAGCAGVAMGVETGDEALRRGAMNKPVGDDEIVAAASRLRRRGIRVVSFTQVGVPGEGERELLRTLRINQRVRPDGVRVRVTHYMPGSLLARRAGRVVRGMPEPVQPDRGATQRNLGHWLGVLARRPAATGAVRALARIWPWPGFFAPLGLAEVFGERRFFGLRWRDALTMATRGGGAGGHTKIINTFLP